MTGQRNLQTEAITTRGICRYFALHIRLSQPHDTIGQIWWLIGVVEKLSNRLCHGAYRNASDSYCVSPMLLCSGNSNPEAWKRWTIAKRYQSYHGADQCCRDKGAKNTVCSLVLLVSHAWLDLHWILLQARLTISTGASPTPWSGRR